MRSTEIHRALAKGLNRYELCQAVTKGVRAIHKNGSRFEDSINDVLQYIGTHEVDKESLHSRMPRLDAQVAVKSLEPAA